MTPAVWNSRASGAPLTKRAQSAVFRRSPHMPRTSTPGYDSRSDATSRAPSQPSGPVTRIGGGIVSRDYIGRDASRPVCGFLDCQRSLADEHAAAADANARHLIAAAFDRDVDAARAEHLDTLCVDDAGQAFARQQPVLMQVAAKRPGGAAGRRILR